MVERHHRLHGPNHSPLEAAGPSLSLGDNRGLRAHGKGTCSPRVSRQHIPSVTSLQAGRPTGGCPQPRPSSATSSEKHLSQQSPRGKMQARSVTPSMSQHSALRGLGPGTWAMRGLSETSAAPLTLPNPEGSPPSPGRPGKAPATPLATLLQGRLVQWESESKTPGG